MMNYELNIKVTLWSVETARCTCTYIKLTEIGMIQCCDDEIVS